MNTDTPETDAAVKASNGQWSFVLKETCQRLERERDQARKGQMEALCDCQRLARKIDDIRDVFDHQDEDWTGSTMLVKAVSKVIRERDEAREALLIIANSEPKNIGSILAQGFFDYHNLKKQEIDERRKKEAKE